MTVVGDLSPHFSAGEFTDSATGHLGVDVAHLVEHLERLRSLCGDRPLRIVSGWRSVATNAAVGGARASQHLYGRAADITPGYATAAQAREAGFTGVGVLGEWATHVDVRPGPPAEWSY
jgi:uncharacterized protein YcbK (DUF882 family)